MAKPGPATIRYAGNSQREVEGDPGDVDLDSISAEQIENDYLFDNVQEFQNTIRFHAVVSEDHKASTQITKFPVQNGFDISNHAIKKNRVITLTGMVSNVILQHTEQARYETNTSNTINTVYEALQNLVRGAVPCEVTTNLGIYDPVIFTKISTKQKAGLVDSIEVTITGEEIQVSEIVARTGPKKLIFTEVPAAKRDSVLNELWQSGINAPEDSILSQATALAGEDFTFSTALTSGELFDLTFVENAWDGISNFGYTIFTSNTDVFSVIDDVTGSVLESLNVPLLPEGLDLLGGLDGITNCLLEGGTSNIVDELETVVDTTMGVLERSIYGAQQDIIKLGKDNLQKALIGTALDCVAVGVSDAVASGNSENVGDLVDEILLGVKGIGDVGIGNISAATNAATGAIARQMTFTKVESPARAPLDKRGEENAPSP